MGAEEMEETKAPQRHIPTKREGGTIIPSINQMGETF